SEDSTYSRVQNTTCHILGIGSSKEHKARRKFIRLTRSTEWNIGAKCFDILRRKCPRNERRPDRTWRDAIYANGPVGERLRERSRKSCNCAFGRRVVQQMRAAFVSSD